MPVVLTSVSLTPYLFQAAATRTEAQSEALRLRCDGHARRIQHALKSGLKLGITGDVTAFDETELSVVQYVLPSLFESGRVCEHCSAHLWADERSAFCCGQGKICLDAFPSPPDELQLLYQEANFITNIRRYNNALTLASLGMGQEIIQPGFSPTVTIQGKMYHSIGSLLPAEASEPKFAQIYFTDSEHEANYRLEHNRGLNLQIVARLQDCLHASNPYIASFKAAIEIMGQQDSDVRIVLDSEKRPSAEHARRYNLPTSSEVAVIQPGEPSNNIDVILHRRDGPLQRIHTLHRSYDALHYILLFPLGTDGFHLKIKHARGQKHVSAVEFYSYHLQVRQGGGNFLMKSRRLMQQYACDQFCKVQGLRLKWIEMHQKQIRAEKYSGLMDAIDNGDAMNAGRRIILPASVYGSPRFYARAFQDAMCIVSHYGKPSLFITFTCNPDWHAIKASLFPGESASDRPDLSVRVFDIKLQLLLKDLFKHHALGKVVAYTVVREHQKRGLPHAHILLILADEDKPRNATDIDRIVSAEIPDKVRNPQLHKIITGMNLHGPCGAVNVNSPCMSGTGVERSCQKKFPKAFCQRTTMSDFAVEYRRSEPADGGLTHPIMVRRQHFTMDNRWVVPYNPFLSLKYAAHINVEIVHSVAAVKYLYKYITKGSDRVMMRLANGEERDITHDEVTRYVNSRYVSASEAIGRLYEMKIQYKYPAVMMLHCHLDGDQQVLFADGEADIAAQSGPPRTTLTEWFTLNESDESARSIRYPDIPMHYTWQSHRWKARKRKTGKSDTPSDMIGRIPVIGLSAHQSETYFLRMLLHHQTGATSYADLKTVGGELLATFQAACLRLGLLDDDAEIDKVMEEAAGMKFGNQLREVFATVLIFIRPSDPAAFYERHMVALCTDYMRRDSVSTPTRQIRNEMLLYLSDRLARDNLQLERDFNLPEPDADFLSTRPARVIREETDYDTDLLREIDETDRAKLNDQQLPVYNTVIESVDNDRNMLISLDASGGTGKTFVLSTILAHVRSQGHVALATAMSGIAATLLPMGRTLHSRLKVPINITDDSTCNISPHDATADLLRRCRLLVIDEVSMANRRIFEAIDRTLKDIRDDERHFGGLTVVFAGDWRQILPVVRKGSRADIVDACFKSSPLWQHVTIMKLSKNMRVALQGDGDAHTTFAAHLLDVGEGKVPIVQALGEHKIKLADQFVYTSDNLKDFCNFVFPDLGTHSDDAEWLTSRAILCPTNDQVDSINCYLLNNFPGDSREYKSSDKIMQTELRHQYPQEFLNTLCPSGMPPHKLVLKEKAPIMLLRNMDPFNGHCNATKYVVNRLNDHIIDATVASGLHSGQRLFIPRIPIVPSEGLFPFQLQRRQFPVRPAFAVTANKAQGQTLDTVGIYLGKDFFSHGQLYVAMSRVGDPAKLKILTRNGRFAEHDGTYTDNVVYHEVL